MSLPSGTRLGPYEILAAIGAGGMGEVYRARDTKLDREVAIKVLPSRLGADPAARSRFEREAKAVAALSHPNILSIFDFGSHAGVAYAVTELLDGRPLRELAATPVTGRKAIDYAVQIARGLAAAHGKGIVHRDVKPENVFVTDDGRVKILDFGLARQTPALTGADATISPTIGRATDPGTVLGTVGYMSPEQVRGEAGDHRSDIFSFGCVLYELVAGRRAFQSSTAAETMTAILREDPPGLGGLGAASPGVVRIVQHCLEKNPAERFQNMSDVAFALDALSGSAQTAAAAAVAGSAGRPRRAPAAALLTIGLVALAVVAGFVGRGIITRAPAPPKFTKLTFQRGTVYSARFAPDGQSVVYGAAWNGERLGLYSARFGAPESRPFGLAADVLAVSSSGEMALSLDRHTVTSLLSTGRLARAPPAGGSAPRELLDGVVDADWSPDGQTLAISREAGTEARIEFPIGRVVFKSGGYLSSPRVSPDGTAVAFINHPVKGDDRGTIAVVDRSGQARTLTVEFGSITGLAWPAGGREIWFSAWIASEGGYGIDGVTLDGRRRVILRTGSRIKLFDAAGGRSLIGYEDSRGEMTGLMAGDARERDLSWLDGTVGTAISPSGDRLLFIEGWEGGGPRSSFFLRKGDSASPVRLGDGLATDLSSDGRWALSLPPDHPPRLTIVPTGTGEMKSIQLPSLDAISSASWFPDGGRVLLLASEPQQTARAWVLEIATTRLTPVTPPGIAVGILGSGSKPLSPDGRSLIIKNADDRTLVYSIDGGAPRAVPGLSAGEETVAWTGDGALFIRTRDVPSRVFRLNPATGARSLWKELMPSDPAGVFDIVSVAVTPDGRYYAYSYLRALNQLHVVEGLR